MPKKSKPSARPRRAKPARPDPVLALPAECLIANAMPLREQLIAVVGEAVPVTLNVSAVERIDTACLQLLAAFATERRAASRPVVWSGVTAALTERARLLDLYASLGLPAQGPS
jgi:ABC-type transporter Mla MlaB component